MKIGMANHLSDAIDGANEILGAIESMKDDIASGLENAIKTLKDNSELETVEELQYAISEAVGELENILSDIR